MALTLEKFQTHIQHTGLFAPADRILLAVSGGMDSMAMWHLFRAAGYTIGIAHMHFQLRADDADLDQQFVALAASEHTTPFYTTQVDTRAYAAEHKLSIEEAARELRYRWLEEIRSIHGYTYIATAHHADDVAETLLLHLVRGTGIKGMSGIPAKNGQVIRPLLFTHREEIKAFCDAQHILFREDASNLDTTYRRNYIRHEILPLLKELNPSIITTMRENAQRFQEAAVLMEERTRVLLRRWLEQKNGDIHLPVQRILHHPSGKTLLFTWLSPYGFNADQCMQIWHAGATGGRQFMSTTHRLVTSSTHFILTNLQAAEMPFTLIDQEVKTLAYGNFRLTLELLEKAPGLSLQASPDTALFDADLLQWPLTLRRWEKGDYFYPMGLFKAGTHKPGKKKVSDLLVDQKMAIPDKERTAVLLSGDHLLWVVGIRQDGRCAVTGKTRRVLRIRYHA